MEEREEEVDDVDGREEDVDDEVAGMQVLVPEYRHDGDLEGQVSNRFQNIGHLWDYMVFEFEFF